MNKARRDTRRKKRVLGPAVTALDRLLFGS